MRALPARAGALSFGPLLPHGKAGPHNKMPLRSVSQKMLEISTFTIHIFNADHSLKLETQCRPNTPCSMGPPLAAPVYSILLDPDLSLKRKTKWASPIIAEETEADGRK